MSGIAWEDPPPVTYGRPPNTEWSERLAPLREHPGRWALIGQFHSATANNIKKGRFAGITQGEFEVTLRHIDRASKGDMYVRFVGKPDLKAVGE